MNIDNVYFKPQLSKKNITFNKSLPLTQKLINDLNMCLKKCFHDMIFSKIPYFLNKSVIGNNTKNNVPDSKLAALKLKAGNCLSYSYYLQNLLNKKGYKSYIIPAKPPTQYMKKGYSHISHVAVALPFNNGYIILDPSIYVKVPVILQPNQTKLIDMTSPYNTRNQVWRFTLQNINLNNINYPNKIQIPKNTPIVHGYVYSNDNLNQPIDDFKYYIREIQNPDLSITKHTNHFDDRIFIASSTDDGDPLAYTSINLQNLNLNGYNRNNYFSIINIKNIRTRNELLKWEGFSDKQAKDLGYKNPLKMKTEFLQILKKMGFTFK